MGISSTFSKKKMFQSKHFTKFIKEYRPQKSRIKFIKNLYTTKKQQQFYCSTVKMGTVYKVLCYTFAVIWVFGDKRPHKLTMWLFMLGPCGYKENRMHVERWG